MREAYIGDGVYATIVSSIEVIIYTDRYDHNGSCTRHHITLEIDHLREIIRLLNESKD